MTPKFELGRYFCTTHLPSSFIVLCLLVRKLSCWQTNKQTTLKTSKALRCATTLGKDQYPNLLLPIEFNSVLYCKWASGFDCRVSVNFQEAYCGYALLIMATYWVTEALPLAVTALLPTILFPLLGILSGEEVASAYIAVCS